MSQTTVALRATSATTAARQAASGLAFAGPASMIALPTTRCQAIDVSGPEDIVIDAKFGIAYVSSQARDAVWAPVRILRQAQSTYSLSMIQNRFVVWPWRPAALIIE